MSSVILVGVVCGAVSSARCETAGETSPSFKIDVYPTNVVKDVRKSTCFPDLGVAGIGGGFFSDDHLLYVKHRERTARAYRESGIWLVRPCGMLAIFAKIKKNPGKEWVTDPKTGRCTWLHPKHYFAFLKDYGLKAIVELDIWAADPERVANLKEFLEWIVANGYQDQISAFEMCNEPFYGKDPEGYARYWKTLFPIIRKVLPKVPLGMPLAEYCEGDPDIAAAKARLLGNSDLGGNYFTANNLNKWSARAVVAMGDDLTNVSHIIYHVYGAAAPYGCGNTGFVRFRNFAKLFPQVADKRWLITEWRPWSDENLQLQRCFRYAIWSGMYIQTCFCQGELDGFVMHELSSLSGTVYCSTRGKWNQHYDSWENGRDLRALPGDDLRFEPSAIGSVFRLCNHGVITHPILVGFGSLKSKNNPKGAFWASAGLMGGGKDRADCQWTAWVNPPRTSMCLMFANGTDKELEADVTCYGYRLLSKTHRFVTCEEKYVNVRDVLGEEKPWRSVNWETPHDGNPSVSQFVTVPPYSVGTVMIGLRAWDTWWAMHLGRQWMEKAIADAKKTARKGVVPTAECCGVADGKVYMVLPNGYPDHMEIGKNLPARKVCEVIGKDPKKLNAEAIKRAKADGFHVHAAGNKVWVFRSTNMPKDIAEPLERHLCEMAGF